LHIKVSPESPTLHPRPRLLRLLPISACLLLLLAALPPLAAAGSYRADSPEYGLSVFLYDHPATTERDLEKVRTLGFGWVRLLLPWAGIEKESKGAYNWAEADRAVQAASSAGFKVIARLDRPPQWARADRAISGPPDN